MVHEQVVPPVDTDRVGVPRIDGVSPGRHQHAGGNDRILIGGVVIGFGDGELLERLLHSERAAQGRQTPHLADFTPGYGAGQHRVVAELIDLGDLCGTSGIEHPALP